MDYSKLPWRSAAVVLWLPDGQTPDRASWSVEADYTPPIPNPEAWWELGDALLSVRSAAETYGKKPWIKVGEDILQPDDILGAYEFFKNHGYGGD